MYKVEHCLFLLIFCHSAVFQPDIQPKLTGVLSRCKIHSPASTEEFEPAINQADKEHESFLMIDIYLLARELDIFRLPGQVQKTQPTLTSYSSVILEIASYLHSKQETCWGRSETGISAAILKRTPSISNKQKLSYYNAVGWEACSEHVFFTCTILNHGEVSDDTLTHNSGVMCLVCVLFSNTGDVKALTGSLSNFIGKPFNNYKQGSCLNDHLKSLTHLFCLDIWTAFITKSAAPKPDVRLGFVTHISVERVGREALLSIMLLLARQGVAIRGSLIYLNADVKKCILDNRASSSSTTLPSCGNFISTVIWAASTMSQDLLTFFQKTSLAALWLSPRCQNRMLHYLAENIREHNHNKIKAAKFFSIMFDESQNMAKNSILAIAERYYDRITCSPCEVITSYLQLQKQNADSIAMALIQQIERNLLARGLPESAFVSATADGCGTNTGNTNFF